MDGPSITGGGGEIASAFVTIGADISSLRAAEQEAKDIVARIGALGGNATVGNPINGATGSVGGGVVLQVKIDEQGIKNQLDTIFRSYTMQPVKVPVELVTKDGASIGGGSGGSSFGPSGDDVYFVNRAGTNPSRIHFDPYGFRGSGYPTGSSFESLRPHAPSLAALEGVETPVDEMEQNYQGYLSQHPARAPFNIGWRRALTIGYLADRGFRSISGFVDAQSVANNPGRIAAGYALSADSLTVGPYANQLAQAQAAEARYAAAESFPVIGGLMGLTGMKGDLDYNTQQAQLGISARIGLQQAAQQASITSLNFSGDSVAAAQAQADLEIQAATRKLFASRVIYSRGFGRGTGSYTPDDALGEYNQIESAANLGVEQAQRRQNAFGIRSTLNKYALYSDEQAANLTASFTTGSRRAGMIESMYGEQYRYQAGAASAEEEAPDLLKPFFHEVGVAGLSALQAQQGLRITEDDRKNDQERTEIQAQGDAARLRARKDYFDAEYRLFQAHAKNLKDAAAGESKEYKDDLNASLQSQEQALIGAHNEQVYNAFSEAGVSFGNSLLSVQAASLRAQGRGREASLLQFQAQRAANQEQLRQAMSQLNFGNIGDVLPRIIGLAGQNLTIGANEQAAQFEDQRYLALSQYSIGARGSAAESRINNQPINAQSINAVTRAQLELANADPRERAALRATLAKELQAQEHDLMGFRSGDMAIDSGLAGSIGLAGGLDLRGVGADRRAAAKTFEQGINDINSGKVVGGNGDQSVKLLEQLVQLGQQALKQMGKNVLPSMFN